jgi:membrane-bound ClpP family serine protease
MSAIVILFLCGLVLLAFEVFVPGLVLGIFGGGCMAAGTVVAFARYGVSAGLATGFLAVVLVAATYALEFWIMPKRGTMKRLKINTGTSGAAPEPQAIPEEVIGKRCVAVTTLAPSGYVKLGDRNYEARSEGGLVPPGSPVTVVGINSFQLLVNPTSVSLQ